MERWKVKVIVAFMIFVLSFIACLLPFKVVSVNWRKLFRRRKKLELNDPEGIETINKRKSEDHSIPQTSLEASPNNSHTKHLKFQDVPLNKNSDHPDHPNHPNHPDHPDHPDHPNHPDHSDHPDHPNQTNHRHRSDNGSKKLLSCLLCLGGGVFLGAFLLHMLPEVIEIMAESSLNTLEYPLTFFLIGVGFFLVLATDVLVGYYQKWRFKKKLKRQFEIDTSQFANPLFVLGNNGTNGAEVEHDNEIVGPDSNPKSHEPNNPNCSDNHSNHKDHSHHDHSPHDHSHPNPSHHDHSHNDHSRQELEQLHQHQHTTRSIVLVLALSLHHIFEGMSIGLQKDNHDVWRLTFAVLIHEIVICFSMGLQFYKTDQRLKKKLILIFLIFSFVLPVGVFLGIIISEIHHGHNEATQNLISGVLQALSSGSFLYVTFFEILFEQLNNSKFLVTKTIFVFLGFGIEALLAIVGHNHHEDHGGHGGHGGHHDSHDDDHAGGHDDDDHGDDHGDDHAKLLMKNLSKLIY